MKKFHVLETALTSLAVVLSLTIFSSAANAATSTWSGNGADTRWTSGANWSTPLSGGESLIFTGTKGLSNTNSFVSGTAFSGVTFSSPAGAFVLTGNAISLSGGVTNGQVVTTETISLPVIL